MPSRIKFNSRLFWDYDIKEEDLEREEVQILYISKVLNNGTIKDVKGIPEELIRKYYPQLMLASKVRAFWSWRLGIKNTEPIT